MFDKIRKLNPLANRHIQVRLVDDKPVTRTPESLKYSAPVAEEGVVVFNKRDLITAVVALTLVNGLVTVGLTVATNIYFDQEVAK